MVCALEEDGAMGREIEGSGSEVFSLGLNIKHDRPRIIWELARLMRRHRIDILHAAAYHPSLFGRLAAILAGVPIRVHHEHLLVSRRRIHRALINKMLGYFTQSHITVSEALRHQVIDWYGLNPNKVEVIYNAVRADFFPSASHRAVSRNNLGLSQNTKVIGMVSRLNVVKGYNYLFAAVGQLRDTFPIRVLIVGFGPHEAEIRRQSEDYGVGSLVEFLGMRRDIPELLSAMDIFVLPSNLEGFSVSLIEAMAAGLPVVVSDIPGNLEAVEPNVSGLVFPSGNVEALKENLVLLLENPMLARKLGDTARDRASSHFTVEQYGSRIRNLYDRLVRERIDLTW